MRAYGKALGLATRVLLLLGLGLWALPAGAVDRPDLPDIAPGPIAATPRPSEYLRLDSGSIVGASGDFNFNASIVREVTKPGGRVGRMSFRLYEPDKVIRKSYLQVIKQSEYVVGTFWASTSGGRVSRSFDLPSSPAAPHCKALLKAVDTNKDGSFETTIWAGRCKKEALDAMGLTAGERQILKRVFGSPNVLKTRGRVRD
jgi:hypothetical protein